MSAAPKLTDVARLTPPAAWRGAGVHEYRPIDRGPWSVPERPRRGFWDLFWGVAVNVAFWGFMLSAAYAAWVFL